MGFWSKLSGSLRSQDKPKTPEGLFLELVLELAAKHPDLEHAEISDETLLVVNVCPRGAGAASDGKLYLRTTFLETRESSPAEKRAAILRLLAFTPDDRREPGWEEAQALLVPLLRMATLALLEGESNAMVARTFLPFLRVFLGMDRGSTVSIVLRSTLSRWQQDEQSAISRAHSNLQRFAQAAPDVELFDRSAPYPIWHVTRDDSNEASRLALPGFLAGFRDKVRGRPIAIVPHRSLLVISGDGDEAAIARLVTMAEAEFEASPRSISPALYTVDEQGAVLPLRLPPDHPQEYAVRRGHYHLAARGYAQQKERLDAHFEKTGRELAIAQFKLGRHEAKRVIDSFAAMPQELETLLPEVDYILLVPIPGKAFMVAAAKVFELAPGCFESAPEYDPPRVRVVGWPDEATLARLRQHAK